VTLRSVQDLFKTLGCKVEKLPAAELVRLGIPDAPGGVKRAVLRVPLTFPEARLKARANKR
jgi:DNA-directed RNA polymerase I subunit RPA49